MRRFLILPLVLTLSAPLFAADKKKDDKKDAGPVVAHIKLVGDFEEGPASDDPVGASETLRTRIERIAKAAKDDKVKALYLQFEGIDAGLFGFGKLDEVRAAVANFKKSGKKVYAFSEGYSLPDYLVASTADVVALPEPGGVEILGLRAELSFYKEMFEKIGVKADFVQMGDYKAAAEPYTRSKMSPESRKQYETVIDDYWQNSVLKTIAEGRAGKKWTPAQVAQLIDGGPFSAKQAIGNGLVDKLAYQDDFEAEIEKAAGEKVTIARNYGKPKSDIDTSSLAGILKLLNPPKKSTSKKPKVAIVYAVGEITSGKSAAGLMGGTSLGSETLVKAIREAEADDTVKAIVLRIDSPGGSALASDVMWDALRKCKKPVIASMGNVAASGGYYIAMGARKVYAEPATLTGSIGVIGGKLATGGAFDKLGITSDTIARGANSGMLSGSTTFTEQERETFRRLMQDTYDIFLGRVLTNREAAGVKMTKDQLLKLAGGRIWTGRQAKEAGLVDALGTLDDALADARAAAKLPADADVEYLSLPKKPNFLESLLEQADKDAAVRAALAPAAGVAAALPEMRPHLRTAEAMLKLRRERVWLLMPHGFSVR